MFSIKDPRKYKKCLQFTTAIFFVLQQTAPVYGMETHPFSHEQVFSSSRHFKPNNIFYPDQIQNLPEELREEQYRLHHSLLTSLGAAEDKWSGIIKEIKKAFQNVHPTIQNVAKSGFPNLIEPTLSLWPPDLLRNPTSLYQCHHPTLQDDSFKRINEVISKLEDLEKEAVFPLTLLSQIQILRETYLTYCRDICQSSFLKRELFLFPVLMKTEFSDTTYLISRTQAYKLLSIDDLCDIVAKENPTGSSPSRCVGEIYGKQSLIKNRECASQEGTLNPALEWSMSAFHRLLFGDGLVPSALVILPHVPLNSPLEGDKLKKQLSLKEKIKNINYSDVERKTLRNRLHEEKSFKISLPYVVQVTAAVTGKHLGKFLAEALSEPFLFEELDRYNLQELLLSSLLTNPADAKGDNLIVTSPDSNGKRKIIGIDNDLALSSFIVKDVPPKESRSPVAIEGHVLEVRNILFPIPYFMEQTIEESVKQRFLSQKPALFLLNWLRTLKVHQQQYEALLEKQFIDEQTYNNLSLPLQLKEGTVADILKKFIILQECINSPERVTFQKLFEKLSFLAALTYKTLRENYPPLEAFKIIYPQQKFIEDMLNSNTNVELQKLLNKENSPKNSYKVRNQSIPDAILELCKATDLKQLDENSRLQFFKEALVSYFASPTTRNIHSDGTIISTQSMEELHDNLIKINLENPLSSNEYLKESFLNFIKGDFSRLPLFTKKNNIISFQVFDNVFEIEDTDMRAFLSQLSKLHQQLYQQDNSLYLSNNNLTKNQITQFFLFSSISLLNLRNNNLGFEVLWKLLTLPCLIDLDFRKNCSSFDSNELSLLAKLIMKKQSLNLIKLDPIPEELNTDFIDKNLILRTQYQHEDGHFRSAFRKIHAKSFKPDSKTMLEKDYLECISKLLTLFEEQEIIFEVDSNTEKYSIGFLYFAPLISPISKIIYYYNGTIVPYFKYRNNEKARIWFGKAQPLEKATEAIKTLDYIEKPWCSIQ